MTRRLQIRMYLFTCSFLDKRNIKRNDCRYVFVFTHIRLLGLLIPINRTPYILSFNKRYIFVPKKKCSNIIVISYRPQSVNPVSDFKSVNLQLRHSYRRSSKDLTRLPRDQNFYYIKITLQSDDYNFLTSLN